MLKLQYFGHLMPRANSLAKTLMLGKIEGKTRRGRGWDALPTQWTWIWAKSGRLWRTGKPGVLQSMGLQKVRHSDWTKTIQAKRGVIVSITYQFTELLKHDHLPFFKKIEYSWFTLFQVYKVVQFYIDIDIDVLFFRFISIIGYYNILNVAPCAIPFILVGSFTF